jgi:hypothetical protein
VFVAWRNLVTDYTPPPPKNADTQHQIKWLRIRVQSFADGWALHVVFNQDSESLALAEISNAAANIAKANDLNMHLVDHVAQTALKDALNHCREAKERIRWAVMPLIRARQPGDEIFAAAQRTNQRGGFCIPDTPLIEFLRTLAHAQSQRRIASR